METKIQNKIKTIVVTTINGVDILASAEDDELVPVKPLCDLFGIASNKQIEKLTSNPLYSSTGTLRVSVAAKSINTCTCKKNANQLKIKQL
jgi:hypothetical protein